MISKSYFRCLLNRHRSFTFLKATATRTGSHPWTVHPYCTTGQRNMATLSEVISTLKKMAPLSLAEPWDNVGLLVEPDVQKSVSRVFLTNDLTEDVLEEAVNVDANLIVSYHPPVFAPFKKITSDAWKSRIVSRCLGRGIAVYSPHTSWDAVENGLTDWLISCFDGTVSTIQPLKINPEFSHVVTLSASLSDNTLLSGKEIRTIVESSDFQADKHFKVVGYNDSQLQLLCNSNSLVTLNKIAKYSEYKIFFCANKNEPLPSCTTGSGRCCQFRNGLTINAAIEKIKRHLGVDNLMIALARGSTLESMIDSAAAVAGSGASVLRGVHAGLYLTGEMSHHDVLDAVHNNVTVVLANHSNTERSYLNVFAGRLLMEMPQLNVHVSKVDRDPLVFV
ncbi:NIF3-like protein 1 isoform X1 [Metopolophium dirhodum]|uniref:NIF3-like protein 1 isoform X1 n=1 Tax=Metopolophium dirhodum TaxID=44670 RepID=UPI0029907DB6|nr:NIF3-like protein 1 isoform X1 [Metopolophium dirhodum]